MTSKRGKEYLHIESRLSSTLSYTYHFDRYMVQSIENFRYNHRIPLHFPLQYILLQSKSTDIPTRMCSKELHCSYKMRCTHLKGCLVQGILLLGVLLPLEVIPLAIVLQAFVPQVVAHFHFDFHFDFRTSFLHLSLNEKMTHFEHTNGFSMIHQSSQSHSHIAHMFRLCLKQLNILRIQLGHNQRFVGSIEWSIPY